MSLPDTFDAIVTTAVTVTVPDDRIYPPCRGRCCEPACRRKPDLSDVRPKRLYENYPSSYVPQSSTRSVIKGNMWYEPSHMWMLANAITRKCSWRHIWLKSSMKIPSVDDLHRRVGGQVRGCVQTPFLFTVRVLSSSAPRRNRCPYG
jgi:hypothetical protein